MKVSAYHSSNQSDPDVYHDHSDCPTGQQTPSYNKVPGTGGYPRCKQCIDKGDRATLRAARALRSRALVIDRGY